MAVILAPQEQERFAEYMVEYTAEHPDHGVGHAIRFAREKFPSDRQIGPNISSWGHLSWLRPQFEAAKKKREKDLKKAEKQQAARREAEAAFIDSRQKFSVAEELPPLDGKRERKKTPRIWLSNDNKQVFAEAVYLIHREYPGKPWSDVLREANEFLPEYTQLKRKFTTPSQIGWLPAMLEKIGEQKRLERIQQTVDAEAKAKAEEKEEAVQQPATSAPTPSIEDALVNSLIGALRPHISTLMQTPKFQQALISEIGAPGSAQPQSVQEPQPKQKVMIVGMLSEQGREIQKRWGSYYDFRIYDNNVTADKVKANLQGVDKAILMTRFVSHSTQAAMRTHKGFTFCNGSIAAVMEILDKWAKKEMQR